MNTKWKHIRTYIESDIEIVVSCKEFNKKLLSCIDGKGCDRGLFKKKIELGCEVLQIMLEKSTYSDKTKDKDHD